MRKYSMILFLVSISLFAFGQTTKPNTEKEKFNNVIGIESGGILQQLALFNGSNYFGYQNPYMFSFRRIFGSNAVRLNLGGTIFRSDGIINASIFSKQEMNDLKTALGFEHYSYLGKHWNFYFGMDLVFNYKDHLYEYSLNDSMQTINKEKVIEAGISPFLGIQFRVTPRLSLGTETGLDILKGQVKSSRKDVYNATLDQFSTENRLSTNFRPPASIVFRFQF